MLVQEGDTLHIVFSSYLLRHYFDKNSPLDWDKSGGGALNSFTYTNIINRNLSEKHLETAFPTVLDF